MVFNSYLFYNLFSTKFYCTLVKLDFYYICFFSTQLFDFKLSLSTFYFYINFYKSISQNLLLLSFFVKNKFFLTNVIRKFENLFFLITNGYYYYLELRGKNYKLLLFKNSLLFLFGFNHFILCKVPMNIFIFNLIEKELVLSFFSLNLLKLQLFFKTLLNISLRESYKERGLFFYKEYFSLKLGKKKEFF